MELSTGYTINSIFINGIQYVNLVGDKTPGLVYESLLVSQSGIISNIPNGSKLIIGYTPYNHTNVVLGAINSIPNDNTTLSKVNDNIDNSLQAGETAITNIINYNYTIQTKLDKVISLFKNNNNDTIATQMIISESIIKILQDILNEYSVIASAINNHIHSFGTYTVPSSGEHITGNSGNASSGTYVPTSRLTNTDLQYISGNAPQCYVNINGRVIS